MARIIPEYEARIRELAPAMQKGKVIGVATDTTYALVSSLTSKDGVEHLRDLRKLPPSKPLALLLPDLVDISKYAFVDRIAYRLMKRVTPGSYTFILRATKELPRMTLTQQRTVGIRICDRKVVNALCIELGGPLISASATTGHDGYAETADQVAEQYPGIEAVLDAGFVPASASTIIDLTGAMPEVVRVGAGSLEHVLV